MQGYDRLYQVSNYGNVRRLASTVSYTKNGKQMKRFFPAHRMKLQPNKNGYIYVCLSKDGEMKNKRVHRLVADAFLEKEDGKDVVNHIDGNKANNCADNLEWCTSSDNNIHSYHLHGDKNAKRKRITRCDLDFNEIDQWESASLASKKLNISCSNSSSCCRGERSTAGGYKWRYT